MVFTIESRRLKSSAFLALLGVVVLSSLAVSANDADTAEKASARELGVPESYQGTLPSMAAINMRTAELRQMHAGFEEPWAFEFLSPNEVLATERKGRMLRVSLAPDVVVTEVGGLPPMVSGPQQTGLLDVALDPSFASNRWVYFSYTVADSETGRYYATAVARGRLEANTLESVESILIAEPYGWSPSNFGGALLFLPDSTLLVAVGDRSEGPVAQRGDRLQGKVLRLNRDGSVPADNPYIDDASVDDRVWAVGLRNVQGLALDEETGRVFASSHGPMGGDEINVLEAGANYGWPEITYGRNYTNALIGEGTHAEGFEQPIFYYLPSEAISPLAVYRGDMFSAWEGDLLVGALKGQHISRLDVDGGVVRSEYPILGEIGDRIRDIRIGPDQAVWIMGQNTGLWRLALLPESPPPDTPADGRAVYQMACAGCHDSGAGGAPMLAQGCVWQSLREKGAEQLLANTIAGLGNMPARGLCEICEDRHLLAAIAFMLKQARPCEP
jgi:glucose/arabinose dehydrogenase